MKTLYHKLSDLIEAGIHVRFLVTGKVDIELYEALKAIELLAVEDAGQPGPNKPLLPCVLSQLTATAKGCLTWLARQRQS